MRTRSTIPVALAGAALLLASALPATLAKGPGDPEAPITLRLFVQDAQGRQSEPAAMDLQRLAAEIAGDAIRIEPTFGQGADVLGPVGAGEAELGMVPSRDAGDHGVTSLDVLEAPFLIDNDALALAVATSDIADRAMSGLEGIGVTGLSMWPEDLRHLFAMDASGRTFRVPGDVVDADVFAVAGPVGRELIPTLGGRLYWETGEASGDLVGAKDADAQSGALEGMITGLWGAGLPLTPTTVAGDLVVFSKYQMLVANSELLAGLSERQRELLDAIVDAAHQAALERHFTERELALALCEAGHTVIEAGTEARAAWRAAAQPLTERLAADPVTGELMRDIEDLAAETAPSPGAGTCAPKSISAVEPLVSDLRDTSGGLPPNGSYRADVTRDDLIAKGVDPAWADDNNGVYTWTFRDGTVTLETGSFGGEPCTGSATSEGGQHVYLDTPPGGPCGLDFSMVWRPVQEGLRFVLVAPGWAGTVREFTDLQAHLEDRDWIRLDGPMPSPVINASPAASPSAFIGDRLPPDGSYRAEMTLEGLLERGADRQFAGANVGIWTWSFTDGTWSAEHGRERCNGTLWIEDGAVHADERYDGGCGMEYIFRWRAADGGIEVQLVGVTGLELTDIQRANERAFLERTWALVADSPKVGPSPSALSEMPVPGIWRIELTQASLEALGLSPAEAAAVVGVITLTLDGESYGLEHVYGPDGAVATCGGRYEYRDGAVHLQQTMNPADCGTAPIALTWTAMAPDRANVALPGLRDAGYRVLAGEWQRVGDTPGFIGDREPPPGIYRVDATVEGLLSRGASQAYAETMAGVWTYVLTPGRWTAHNARNGGRCQGTSQVVDGVIRWADDPDPLAWCVMAGDWRWRPEADGIRARFVATGMESREQLQDYHAFNAWAMVRVGDAPAG